MAAANPLRQRQAMMRKLERRMACEGKITLPAVPSLLDEYTERCGQLFAASGRQLNEAERAQLRLNLDSQLQEAFSRSPRSSIAVSYSAATGGLLHYVIKAQHASLEQTYEGWIGTREPPYFGLNADAKIMALSRAAGDPAKCHVLDIGAGTGRNALALASLGHPVDAVELTAKFAQLLRDSARKDGLDVRVIVRDVFASREELRRDYKLILLSEVVPDFRSVDQLRDLFELASQRLSAGGQLAINCFVARAHYSADDAAREFAQQVYSGFFTRAELNEALVGLSLNMVSDENVFDFEKNHLKASAWPPTPWYPEWVSGQDIFSLPQEDSPVEMRWLVYQKTC